MDSAGDKIANLMKTLFLLRHAKSSWDDVSLADFDRPLNKRGLRTAPFMGELMRQKDHVPDVIYSSPAKRARATAELVKAAAEFGAAIITDDRIYEASAHALADVVRGVKNEASSVLVVGHNPGMEGFLDYLTGKREPLPTAALAVIDLDIETWTDLDMGSGKLHRVYRPRELMG